jgi:hypothetical protein
MLGFQIVFDFIIAALVVVLIYTVLSSRKKTKDFKESFISLKDLFDNFEKLIERCEVEGGKLLEELEDERIRAESLLDKINMKENLILKPDFKEATKSEQLHDYIKEAEPENTPLLQDHLKKKYFDIYKLADEGKTSQQIEKDLAIPLGEIDLILSLRK